MAYWRLVRWLHSTRHWSWFTFSEQYVTKYEFFPIHYELAVLNHLQTDLGSLMSHDAHWYSCLPLDMHCCCPSQSSICQWPAAIHYSRQNRAVSKGRHMSRAPQFINGYSTMTTHEIQRKEMYLIFPYNVKGYWLWKALQRPKQIIQLPSTINRRDVTFDQCINNVTKSGTFESLPNSV